MLSPVYVATLSELFGKADMKRFRKTVLLSFCTNVSIGAVLSLPFLCFPSQVMAWCFGESFRNGGGVLALLGLAAILHIVGNVVDQVMVSMGKLWLAFAYVFVGSVTSLIVACLTVADWGGGGLALALLTGLCVRIIFYGAFYVYFSYSHE